MTWRTPRSYDLTGSTEADMDLNRISDESPVGAAMIGCKARRRSFNVTLPNGNIITYKLLDSLPFQVSI